MKTSLVLLKWVFFIPLAILAISHLSAAEGTQPISETHGLNLLNSFLDWRQKQLESQLGEPGLRLSAVLACLLCFIAASVSSAGGVGGGSLYLPILNLVAGVDLKTAASYSAFMVTGGSLSNVLYNIFSSSSGTGGKPLIDYDITLLSQPCMLLGVSVGVVCNVMFPEWLITVLFAVALAFSTYKTCASGFRCWKDESDEVRGRGACGLEGREGEKSMEEPLLWGGKGGPKVPWRDILVLLLIWLCFFLVHVLRGDKGWKGVLNLRPCGVAYWLITLSQVPFAIVFTSYILYEKKRSLSQDQQHIDSKYNEVETRIKALPVFVFPVAALLTGVFSGLFGIGGGLLINPVLLQIGIPPQTTAATTNLMVLFSASMSMAQFVILGVKGIKQALAYATVCFVASAIGLLIMQRVITKSGRVSIIVFTVGVVMALSMISITCFGAVDVWIQYTSGEHKGFKPPC